MKDLVGLVAVRTSSKRLKNKAFRKIKGREILNILIDRLNETPYLDDFVICTTVNSLDDSIERLCLERGVKFFRGEEKNVLSRFINASKIIPSKYVARITGDNPLSDFKQMHNCYKFMLENNLDYSRPEGVPYGTAIEVIKFSSLEKIYSNTLTPELSEYMTYFFELADFVKKDLYHVSEKSRMPDLRLTIDYEEDIEFMNEIFKNFEKVPDLEEVVSYCKSLESYPRADFKIDYDKLSKIKSSIKFKV